jgi:hypothetical protein
MIKKIAYDFYRTENIVIKEVPYTIRFAISKDKSEYVLFVSNNQNNEQKKYSFSEETADDYKHYHGENLSNEVFKLITGAVESKTKS